MIVCIAASMQFTDRMLNAKKQLEDMGHEVRLSGFASQYAGKSDEEIEALKLKHKYEQDAIREFWYQMQDADALLVLNYDKNGIHNYVGGNTLMEIGFAHVLDMDIYLLNPIPDMQYCDTEIRATNPTILDGNLAGFPDA